MPERRVFPRFPLERPVELRGPDGARFDVRSSDISVAGIGLRVSHTMVVALAQGGTILTTGDRFELVLPGTLNASAQGGLTLGCRVKQVRRLSQHEYHVGAWFIDPTPGQKDGLAALVDAARSARSS